MDGYNESIMFAFLPTTSDWCSLELPHMTLVYGGEIKDLPTYAFNEMAKDASYLSSLVRPFTLEVIDVEVFGDEEKVNVLKLRSTQELLAARSFVEKWNKSQYPFNPHATIGPVGSLPAIIPSRLHFNRLILSWGNDNLVFQLSS